jgi:hypothetical protein
MGPASLSAFGYPGKLIATDMDPHGGQFIQNFQVAFFASLLQSLKPVQKSGIFRVNAVAQDMQRITMMQCADFNAADNGNPERITGVNRFLDTVYGIMVGQ